jgi:hypothetical protein
MLVKNTQGRNRPLKSRNKWNEEADPQEQGETGTSGTDGNDGALQVMQEQVW